MKDQKKTKLFPQKLAVSDKGGERVLRNLHRCNSQDETFSYAKFGIYKGATAEKVLENFPKANLHFFDFEANIRKARPRLAKYQFRIIFCENSPTYLDSYNWKLMLLIKEYRRELFDYVFLDGAHVWGVDGFTFSM